ncbi:hypothetical protein BSKO_11683 [Bryopsis sp. KO-2023]|nr:hypothetical protein BSKO_11683 [Bryopsis sp. KO-2023]
MASKGENSAIDIFLRVRPTERESPMLGLDAEEGNVNFAVPKDQAMGYVNNQRERFDFKFNGVFDAEAKQDKVFTDVAREVVSNSLEGMNGTIFAYGQTGSGKTFTITGGPDRYQDRGLIPRAISHIFSDVARRTDHVHTISISYLEIYQDMVYDLLDPDREVKDIEDLPKVMVREDEDGNIVLQNLRMCAAGNEEEALGLLFLGDTNRTISETPMNMASSRSHCIFTVYVEARKIGEEVVKRSKLNLVDLAGSERVKKTGIDGTTFTESRYINLSLHFLEQVIIALQERSMGYFRPHIPYRNSAMTMVLRDSLGGNCRTVMIATISVESEQIDESISTCRFAQRVAMVSNQVVVNEEIDPKLVIRRLKQEIKDLKEEVKMLRGGELDRGPLTEEEREKLKTDIEEYCESSDPELVLEITGGMPFIRAGYEILKDIIKSGGCLKGKENESSKSRDPPEDQVRKLKLQIQQRDNEISVLVSMLKKKEGGVVLTATENQLPAPTTANKQETKTSQEKQKELLDVNILADRNKTFEVFRKSYRRNQAIEDNKNQLRKKYEEAKEKGRQLNQSKTKIAEFKAVIEQARLKRCVAKVNLGQEGTPSETDEQTPEEIQATSSLNKEKTKYKEALYALRDLKKEIEHLQMLLEQSRVRLQKDFEQWLAMMSAQKEAQIAAEGSSTHSENVAPEKRSESFNPPKPKLAWVDTTKGKGAPSISSGKPHFKDAYIQSLDIDGLDSETLTAVRAHLTGNPEADRDIVKFYEARARLLKTQNHNL